MSSHRLAGEGGADGRRAFPRTVSELRDQQARSERVHRVSTARVVLCDYALLREDFPWLATSALAKQHEHLSRLAGASREHEAERLIDAWLLRRCAVISEPQRDQTLVNSPIMTHSDPVAVVRLPRAGRGVTVPLPLLDAGGGEPSPEWVRDLGNGILDLKGVGVGPGQTPAFESHKDGLLSLASALKEVVFQHLLGTVLRHAGSPHRVLPVYGVIDLGFDAITGTGLRYPAGVVVRRGNRRPPRNDYPAHKSREQVEHLNLELLFRRYGISSTNFGTTWRFDRGEDGGPTCWLAGSPYTRVTRDQLESFLEKTGVSPPAVFESINIQTTLVDDPEALELIDFGHYRVMRRFAYPLLSAVADRPFEWGGYLAPDHPQYVQPDAELAVPYDEWGYEDERQWSEMSRDSPPNGLERWVRSLALAFRCGGATSESIRVAIRDRIHRATSHLAERSGQLALECPA